MEILDEKIIDDIMNELIYYTDEKSNILNSDNIEIAEKELDNSIEILKTLKIVFNEKKDILNLFISLGKVKEDGEMKIFKDEFIYLLENFEKIEKSLLQLRKIFIVILIEVSEKGFKNGFLAHKELNKLLNM
ncbi:hypothetical protein [Peptacetobacter hiranonis]|uniref:hypothetical protein n=1 Tax=Peptacetobacter hiranonis TaxID=89152 RepID=UPI002E788E6D|nr:hypothetical protein [Peptacetobacter hiranonis]MEE0248946.1 hypothetical protein [Peptacetobacter hiranonis]